MSSPWAKITMPEPVNFADILSEEVAKEIQFKEDKKLAEKMQIALNENEQQNSSLSQQSEQALLLVPDEISDEVIAKMLQKQFDKEYDDILKRTEDKFNGTSKVSVSFSNYRRSGVQAESESEEEEDEQIEDPRDKKDWDRFDTIEREFNIIPSCGYRMQEDGTMITKHDMTMSGRRNACKMMNFPPNFHTGDGAGFDLKMSNKVFNSLKTYSSKEQARRHRVNDKKDRAIAEFGIDLKTRLLLYKLINNQVLERVYGIISIGKEAVILNGDTDLSFEEATVLPKECIIKVFKTILSEFKHREKYIRDDYRFKDRIGKQSIRKTIHLWAEKEMRNLNRLRKAEIPCPNVICLKQHVLVMSLIGENHKPAPKLKDAILDEVEYVDAYNQVLEGMKKMYQDAKLIHADLSEYNILWYDGKCYFIDVSQSTEPGHVGAFQFLMRDCENVCHFFKKKGVNEVQNPHDLFRDITGCDFTDKAAILDLENKFREKPHITNRVDTDAPAADDFEEIWQRIKTGDLAKAKNEDVDEPIMPLIDKPID